MQMKDDLLCWNGTGSNDNQLGHYNYQTMPSPLSTPHGNCSGWSAGATAVAIQSLSDAEDDNLSTNAAPASGEVETDYILMDYEEEMELCSQYVFSGTGACPSDSTTEEKGDDHPQQEEEEGNQSRGNDNDVDGDGDGVNQYPQNYIPYDYDAALYSDDDEESDAYRHLTPYSPEWVAFQRLENELHHKRRDYSWKLRMMDTNLCNDDQFKHSMRALLGEACRRDMQRLRAAPESAFVDCASAFCGSASLRSMRSFLLTACSPTEERKGLHLQRAKQQWRDLAAKVEREIGSEAACLRTLSSALNSLCLFSGKEGCIIRDFDLNLADEQKRQRRERAAQLLATLKEQGRLFVLPRLFATEVEEPTPVEPTSTATTVSLSHTTEDWSVPSYGPNGSEEVDDGVAFNDDLECAGAFSQCSSGSSYVLFSAATTPEQGPAASGALPVSEALPVASYWGSLVPALPRFSRSAPLDDLDVEVYGSEHSGPLGSALTPGALTTAFAATTAEDTLSFVGAGLPRRAPAEDVVYVCPAIFSLSANQSCDQTPRTYNCRLPQVSTIAPMPLSSVVAPTTMTVTNSSFSSAPSSARSSPRGMRRKMNSFLENSGTLSPMSISGGQSSSSSSEDDDGDDSQQSVLLELTEAVRFRDSVSPFFV